MEETDINQIYIKPLNIQFKFRRAKLFVDNEEIEPNIRTFKEMKKVLKHPYVLADSDSPMYYMYRHIFDKINIRYDITYMPAKMIDDEYNKTHGHYHPKSDDGFAYPELYRIILGKAIFILQKENRDGSTEVYVVHGKEGDVVFIPPGYGHTSINPTKDTDLLLENLVSDLFVSEYSRFEKNNGAAYYYTTSGLIQNTNYFIKNVNQIKSNETIKLLNGLRAYSLIESKKEQGLLDMFYNNYDEFVFLNKPHIVVDNLKKNAYLS